MWDSRVSIVNCGVCLWKSMNIFSLWFVCSGGRVWHDYAAFLSSSRWAWGHQSGMECCALSGLNRRAWGRILARHAAGRASAEKFKQPPPAHDRKTKPSQGINETSEIKGTRRDPMGPKETRMGRPRIDKVRGTDTKDTQDEPEGFKATERA